MEECTLRSCVDRFNNRRYLSAQAYLNAKNVLSNTHVSPHLLANANNTNIQVSATTSNMTNQMGFAAGGVGTIGNGVNSNGKWINSSFEYTSFILNREFTEIFQHFCRSIQ